MKLLLLLLIISGLIYSCKKDLSVKDDYLSIVTSQLKDSLPDKIFGSLDMEKSSLVRIGKDSFFVLRIPFQFQYADADFLLLQTTTQGKITLGRIIALTGISDGNADGTIITRSLDGQELVRSVIEGGYVQSYHPKLSQKADGTSSMADPYKELPEVIIVSTIRNNTQTATAWISLTGFLSNTGGAGGYYSPYNPGSSGGSGGGGGSYPAGVTPGTVIKVDFEKLEELNTIDVNQYVRCFDNLPDAGATCSVEIFSDIPVDSDPQKLFDWENESPGHTFIQIKKQNGGQTVQQNIGFYPATNWKSIITPAPVAGKFADNAGHEFNASIKMNVNPAQLREILVQIQYLARFIRYDIDEYNCTDFALQVFNTTRLSKLVIPKYDIPGGENPYGTNTPQGLYQQLKSMKDNKHPEAGGITVGIVKGWVGTSKGPCK